VRRVWLWFRSEELNFPLQSIQLREIQWVAPTYHAIHSVLTSPVYAGAYVYGKTRHERYVDEQGRVRKRVRKLPRSEWGVLIPEHHEGYIDWASYEANQTRISTNIRPLPHQGGGAVREGAALLQGLATCGHCGRRLRTHYRGRNHTPGYHCAGKDIVDGRGVYCLSVGGVQIDEALTHAFLEALTPAGMQAALAAAEQLEANHDAALGQWRLALERARYEAERAERRYRAVEPENRLVARGLEAEWEQRLRDLEQAAKILGTAPSTIHRWLNDGFIAGEQITPGAPWQIRLTDELLNRFVEDAPEGFVTMQEATKILGVSRQTVLQRVKSGELDAVHVYRGRKKGIRINVNDDQLDLFNQSS